MHLETFTKRLAGLTSDNQDFNYHIGESLDSGTFQSIEQKLDIVFPAKVKDFLSAVNGLQTHNPAFEILDLNELRVEGNLIQFAIFDETIQICFKVDKYNNAGEWTIIEKETKFEITQTIASFWSNKIWHWLEKRHEIWKDNWW